MRHISASNALKSRCEISVEVTLNYFQHRSMRMLNTTAELGSQCHAISHYSFQWDENGSTPVHA